MQTDFTDLIETAEVVQRQSKAGRPYYMLVFHLDGNVQLEFLCLKGEENVVKALTFATKK
jgi:hypothetical protein